MYSERGILMKIQRCVECKIKRVIFVVLRLCYVVVEGKGGEGVPLVLTSSVTEFAEGVDVEVDVGPVSCFEA